MPFATNQISLYFIKGWILLFFIIAFKLEPEKNMRTLAYSIPLLHLYSYNVV